MTKGILDYTQNELEVLQESLKEHNVRLTVSADRKRVKMAVSYAHTSYIDGFAIIESIEVTTNIAGEDAEAIAMHFILGLEAIPQELKHNLRHIQHELNLLVSQLLNEPRC